MKYYMTFMTEIISKVNDAVNSFVWGIPMLVQIGRASCRERVLRLV